MKKRSMAMVLESEAYAQKQNYLNAIGVNDAINDEITWTPKINVEGGRARFGWSRLDSAHGGIFYSWFAGDNQNPHTSVYYLDDEIQRADQHGYMIRQNDKHALALREAVYSAQNARRTVYTPKN